MHRRLSVAAIALGGLLCLPSCSSVTTNAAIINGDDVPMTDLDEIIKGYQQVLAAQAPTVPEGTALESETADANIARGMLSVMIRRTVYDEALTTMGHPVTDTDRATAEATVAQDPSFADFPPLIKELAVGVTASQQAFLALPGPTAAEFQPVYEQGVERSQVACVSHILVATEAEANVVLDRVTRGEAFADVAKAVSTDTGSGQAGGVLTGDVGTCYSASGLAGQLVPEFVAAAMAAEPGVPTQPVQSEFGYHVILLRPWAEVADDAVVAARATTEQRLFATADVTVNSSIGAWSPTAFAVVPLDSTPAANG